MQIPQEFIFGVCLFATVLALAYALSGFVFRKDPVASRLRPMSPDEMGGSGMAGGRSGGFGSGGGRIGDMSAAAANDYDPREPAVPVMERIGHAAGKPFMPKSAAKQSSLRKQLMHAGIYSSNAMEMVVGLKVILLAVGAVGGYVIGNILVGAGFASWFVYMALYVGAVLGFFMPTIWLKMKIKNRRRALESSLPDALDLMVVCVESGLTLDASLQRVGQEIALAHPDISKEFGITHMETRVGLTRVDALRNLGQRTGSSALQSLAAMLVQTERFGTSIAQALRVHAESLRVKRQHAAEEQAGKTTVKLAFPVVLCIFPVLIVVLGGPAFILFFRSPLFHRQTRPSQQQTSQVAEVRNY
jgi:tight adherence protein C